MDNLPKEQNRNRHRNRNRNAVTVEKIMDEPRTL